MMNNRQQLVDDTVQLLRRADQAMDIALGLPRAALSDRQLEDLQAGANAFLHQCQKVGIVVGPML